MQCTRSRRRVCEQSMLSVCKSSAVCMQCVCSTRVMSLHVQDTVCAVHMHLEAVGGAFSMKQAWSVCTSETQAECSWCAASVQGVCHERGIQRAV